MDQTFELHFQEMQQLDSYCENGKFEDMPLSNEFLDDFGMASHQLATPGGLPSPNSTNPDLPGSGRQSPFLPDLSTLTDGYGSQQSDTTSGADSGPLDLHLLQQSQELRTFKSGSNASISHPSTNQSFSNASNDCSQAHVQQWEPSMTSSYPTNAGQYEAFMAPVPSEGSLCISNDSLQSRAATVPSNGSFKQKTPTKRPTSTHLPIAPKVVHNTSSVSAPANSPHSPTSKSQHFIPHPSHLRHQVHPELLQYSPFPVTATDHSTTGQVAHTMSSTHNFTNSQEPNASPSRSDYQHVQQSSNRPPFRRITSGHNQSRGSPNSQNYQPFQESSLRTSVTANPDRDLWEAGQFQTPEYPDPQPTFQHQSNRSPYMVHNVISGFQGNATVSDSPEQYRTRPSDSEDASFMSQEPRDFGFNGSSPMSIKHEVSSPYSDHVVSPPKFQSPLGSPKSQKKRRVKQESKNNDDNEVAVDAVALQTADLTSLSSTDHTNVAALINAMHNTDNVEDNLGMQKTWERVRRAKALRIREVCVDLLVSLKFDSALLKAMVLI